MPTENGGERAKMGDFPTFPLDPVGRRGDTAVMIDRQPIARQADAKGRLSLGSAYANRMLIIEDRGDEIVLRPARVIPEREAWLYENPRAFESVRRGVEQARSGKLVAGPSMEAAASLARQIPDE